MIFSRFEINDDGGQRSFTIFIFAVIMAKGIGNGVPLAAVVTTPEIAQALDNAIFLNEYGGSPLPSAVGKAVLDVSSTFAQTYSPQTIVGRLIESRGFANFTTPPSFVNFGTILHAGLDFVVARVLHLFKGRHPTMKVALCATFIHFVSSLRHLLETSER